MLLAPRSRSRLKKKNAEPENVLAWNILPMHIAHGQELSCAIRKMRQGFTYDVQV